jgi:long-subunit fatty acid transport protein
LRVLLGFALLLLAPVAHAGGLFTPDTGMVGLSRGGANVANAEDIVGALYYNPAGLTQLDGFHIQGGIIGMQTLRWFQRSGGDGGEDFGQYNVDADGNVIPGSLDDPFPRTNSSPHFRAIPEGGLAIGFDNPDLTIALGVYAPMAPTQLFDRYGPGRYRLVEQTLVQGNINFAAAIRPVPWLSLGAGFQLLILSLDESFVASGDLIAARISSISDDPVINAEDPQWDVFAEFSAMEIRPYVNVGVLVEPTPWLRFGLTWSPPYEMEAQGTAKLSGTLGTEFFSDSTIGSLFGSDPVHVRGEDDEIVIATQLPMQFKFGVRVAPVPEIFDFEIDVHVEIWNPESDVVASGVDMPLMYDDPDQEGEEVPLDQYLASRGADTFTMCDYISADNGCLGLDVYTGEGGGGSVAVPTSFGTSWSLRFGGEVNPVPWLGLRGGLAYESPAIPLSTQSLTMLDGDKLLGSLGVELRAGAWDGTSVLDVRLTYAYVDTFDRTVSAEVARARTLALEGVPVNSVDAGEYGGESHYIGLTMAANISEMVRRDRARRTAD